MRETLSKKPFKRNLLFSSILVLIFLTHFHFSFRMTVLEHQKLVSTGIICWTQEGFYSFKYNFHVSHLVVLGVQGGELHGG